MFLAEVDWGGLSETQDQEFVFAVVPQDLGQRPLAEFICAKDAHTIVNNIWIQAMNVTGDSDWFARNAGIVTGYRNNYLEIYQPSAFQDHRIGTIRVYDMGALISRIWILEPLMDGRKRYSFNHFQTALRGTLEFAKGADERVATFSADLAIGIAPLSSRPGCLWFATGPYSLPPLAAVGGGWRTFERGS